MQTGSAFQRADMALDIRTAATKGAREGRRGGSRVGDRFALAVISLALDEVDATQGQTGTADAKASVRA